MSVIPGGRCELSVDIALRPRLRLGVPGIAGAGFVAAAVTVVAGGRVGPVPGSFAPSSWLGLSAAANARLAGDLLPGIGQELGIGALVLVWLITLVAFRRTRPTPASVWKVAACWAAPFAVGPPLLSSDVYTYAAQGTLITRGLDPYRVGPAALGGGDAVTAVDPVWRNATSPYGPLAALMEHLSAAVGGSTVGAVVVLRLIALASVVVIGLCAATLVPDDLRVTALACTILNPLLLLQVVSAAHLEGAMCALLLVAVVVHRRSPMLALVAACAATAIKAPAAIAIIVIVAEQWQVRTGLPPWANRARMAAVVAGTWVALGVLVQNGWGWLAGLNTPVVAFSPGSPTALLGRLLALVVPWAPSADVTAASRLVGLCAAACIVGYLAVTATYRPVGRSIGYGLLAVAALGPVIYPWYFLWGVIVLAATAAHQMERRILIGASVFACFMDLTGLSHGGLMLTETLLVGVAIAIAARWRWTRSAAMTGRPAQAVHRIV